jgi:hypothetical protein
MPAALNLQHTDVAPPNILSDPDNAYLMLNYSSPTPPLSLDFCLGFFRVDAVTAQSIEEALAQGKITKMRAIFHAFLLSGRLAASAAPSSPAHGEIPASAFILYTFTYSNRLVQLSRNLDGVRLLILSIASMI